MDWVLSITTLIRENSHLQDLVLAVTAILIVAIVATSWPDGGP